MNHACAVVASCLQSARSWCWRSIQGSSEQLGVLWRQDVMRLCFKHAFCFSLYRCTQKVRFVDGKR